LQRSLGKSGCCLLSVPSASLPPSALHRPEPDSNPDEMPLGRRPNAHKQDSMQIERYTPVPVLWLPIAVPAVLPEKPVVAHRLVVADTADRVRESLTFSRDKTFEREAVVDERALLRDGLRRGMGEVTFSQVRANLETRLCAGGFQLIERPGNSPARQFTTARTIAAEWEILRRFDEGRNQLQPALSRSQAIAVADQHPHLNRAQRTVVEDVLISPDRVQGIQGYAGTRKTTTLSVIRAAVESQGYAVEGFAPTSRAARQLAEAGVDTATLQGFLARGSSRDTPEKKHFYFVDESSLASTNQIREFLSRLGAQDRVLLIGDTRQHQGVEAGRPFEQLQQAGMRTAQLDEIVRQKDLALKSTVESLAKGDVSAAIESMHKHGRIREIPDADERIRAIARSYVEAPERTLIVSPDNASRRDLNVAVREELKSKGTLAPEDHQFKVLIQRQEITGAERRWASGYEIGDVVRYTRGSKEAGIDSGTYATVVDANPAMNLVSVEQPSGNLVTYDPRRLTGVSVYREVAMNSLSGIGFNSQHRTSPSALQIVTLPQSIQSGAMERSPYTSIVAAKSTSTRHPIVTSIMDTL
jgi:ATP-dependent exoDNAse (exonuclease V) alpha subunit